jgi:hypothetical protein
MAAGAFDTGAASVSRLGCGGTGFAACGAVVFAPLLGAGVLAGGGVGVVGRFACGVAVRGLRLERGGAAWEIRASLVSELAQRAAAKNIARRGSMVAISHPFEKQFKTIGGLAIVRHEASAPAEFVA